MRGDWGILELFKVRKSWEKVHPLGWILFFAIIALIIGLLVNGLNIIAIVAGAIIFVFVIYFIVWWINS